MRAKFDLVGFDPRGIGNSTALRCFGTDRQWAPFFTSFWFPMTEAELATWIAADHYLDDSCAQRGGAIAEHMSTANVARDLDRLRQAVGDADLSYAGVSYGSYLGATYASLFPDKVGAVVVDGVLDPVAWSTGVGDEARTIPFSTRLHSDAGAWATLQEFFRLCDAGGERCAFAGDAQDRYTALAERLLEHPVLLTFPDGFQLEVNYSVFVGLTLGALYDSSSWPTSARCSPTSRPSRPRCGSAPRSCASASARRTSRVAARRATSTRSRASRRSRVPTPTTRTPTTHGGRRASRRTRSYRTSAGCGRGPAGSAPDWPFRDADRYAGPWTRATAHPVLVIGNLFDPATPYHGAQRLASLLPGSRLLTVAGWGRTSLFLSACADAAITRYLVDGQLPPAGTVCEQDEVPFADN